MNKIFVAILLSLLAALIENTSSANTPVVLWHGMGDSCCNPLSMGSIKKLIESKIPGVYVSSLRIGKNTEEDVLNGFFKNVNDQVQDVCNQIKNDTNLKNGFHAIGFSQGGQFLRAVQQRCGSPSIINLISVGGQQQGVYGFPRCPINVTSICDEIRRMLNYGAYESFIQDTLVQAEYWHDPLKEAEYRDKSVFLADINQEKTLNPTYKNNLLKIKNFVLVKFTKDTMVVPRESEWFGFYKPGQSKELYDMESSPLYLNDTIGLQTLDKSGRLFKLSVDGDHLQFTDQWFIDNIIDPFLRD